MESELAALTGSEGPQTVSQGLSGDITETVGNLSITYPAEYGIQVKVWLEAEILAWLAAEEACQPEKDWQRINLELERIVNPPEAEVKAWLDAEAAFKMEARDWKQAKSELEELVSAGIPVPVSEPVKVKADYLQRIDELLADVI